MPKRKRLRFPPYEYSDPSSDESIPESPTLPTPRQRHGIRARHSPVPEPQPVPQVPQDNIHLDNLFQEFQTLVEEIDSVQASDYAAEPDNYGPAISVQASDYAAEPDNYGPAIEEFAVPWL